MLKRRTLFFVIAAAGLMLFASVVSNAQNAAIVTENNNCLIPGGDRVIYAFKCTDGGVRYTVTNGFIKTADNMCFDHGVVRGTNPNNNQRAVRLVGCHGGASQQWFVFTSDRQKGLFQNAANADVCLNLEGGADRPGTRVIVWPCGFNGTGANERFYLGNPMSKAQFAGLPPAAQSALNAGQGIIFNNGAHMVAAGGGNMVAAGAGNMVAAGSLNMVAAGAGNLVGNDGASIAAAVANAVKGVPFRPTP